MKHIKLAYIGGGSKAWARVFMNDLALAEGLSGEIALYDIDLSAAERNRRIGERINAAPETVSKWDYVVYESLESALTGADFVAISILPGTFDEMESDVHAPEKYGIFQSVGDTVGPGGVLRAMRTVPIYEEFARAIRKCCPEAWVINLTNPMTACCKTLFDVFPAIKAFGCCHEVFHAEEFLACVAAEELGVPKPDRRSITVDASGVNHFTWITEANFEGHDLLKLLPKSIDKWYDEGHYEYGDPLDFRSDPFRYGNKVKMDLFRRYGVLAAAGDRHLVEFMKKSRYLRDKNSPDEWLFHLTSVDYRRADQRRKIEESELIASGKKPIKPEKSSEELIELMKALLGFGKIVSNANTVNRGQVAGLPIGSVVEVNHVFDKNSVKPIVTNPLPGPVLQMVAENAMNIENTYYGIKERDLEKIFAAFMAQPLCCELSWSEGEELFRTMIRNTKQYLSPYYDLRGIL
ncbi:MAG: alpha-glucosidase/alpha-galactosidase [Oscillospiraceae bacterium]|nr:alpha-glucosidase/alpha-galactosidase [Oscillospiraceae bacterium]